MKKHNGPHWSESRTLRSATSRRGAGWDEACTTFVSIHVLKVSTPTNIFVGLELQFDTRLSTTSAASTAARRSPVDNQHGYWQELVKRTKPTDLVIRGTIISGGFLLILTTTIDSDSVAICRTIGGFIPKGHHFDRRTCLAG